MKQTILLKSERLLWKYNHTLKEIIAQRYLFANELMFWAAWTKFASTVNKLQGNVIKYS